ncbi:MAG TPA: CDP-diacylglycerol--serine O-phosphatidyltransferase [Gemmatimonadaceae bacterium]|nr:CDP-diacylglycerol--serine O-phosphatidyltransferase [Gemmatimonadaceae bacterium]
MMLTPNQARRQQHPRGPSDRPRNRGVIILPNGFTLMSLFFGMFAIVAASRSEFDTAGLYIVFGGICDALDGRVARATGTGSRFGEELDSLVDAITFGLAPAIIMYFAVLNRNGWDWIFAFFFTACAVIRLARFNVEQAGRAKKYFHGLPSPIAGMTLATYYWFSQTSLYNQTVVGDLNWTTGLRGLMLLLAFLMISNVSYPAVPTVGFRKISEILGTLVVIATFIGVLFLRKEFYFPALICYVLYGIAKTVIFGLLDRVPRGDSPVIDDDDDEEPLLLTAAGVVDSGTEARQRSHRRKRRRRPPGPGDSTRGGPGNFSPPSGPVGGQP